MILLDTCAIIWDALEPDQLSDSAREAIETGYQNQTLIIADISQWEIAMLIRKGRVSVGTSAARFLNLILRARNIRVQSITPEIADLSVNFGNGLNNDPADRLIVASTIINKARLVTADKDLLKSSLVETIW